MTQAAGENGGGGTTPLFREEALDAGRARWLGPILLAPRVSHAVLAAVAVVLAAGVLLLVTFGEYTRKVRLGGWLTPDRGLIQVAPPQPGVILRLDVAEGEAVRAGQPLAALSTEIDSLAVGATQAEVARQLRARRDSLRVEREQARRIAEAQVAAIEARLQVMAAEEAAIEGEFALQRQRTALAESAVARQRDLVARALTTEINLQAAEEGALDQAIALQGLERSRTALARERLEAEAALREGPLRAALAEAEIDRQIAMVEQELALAEAAREIVVAAPGAGVVTAVQASAGAGVTPDRPLLTIVPDGALLQARLYGPSRAIGFVRPGQRVLLRFEAFPHQKFGQYGGVVESVSRATVGDAERGAAAAALPGVVDPSEPLYRIVVALDAQDVVAYGAPATLQAGMRLEADVLIETRRVWEWVLDPLRALRGAEAA